MTSGTSLFNKTVFSKNLTRMWPVWVLFSLAGFVVGASNFLGMIADLDGAKPGVLDVRYVYYNMIGSLMPIATFVIACIVTAGVWGYLYTQKGTVFFHSLPVTRNALFVTNVISTLVMVTIPVLTGWLTYTLMVLTRGVFDAKGAFTCLYATIAEAFIMLSIALVCAQLAGRTSSMILLDITSNFFFPVVGFLWSGFSSGFLYGVSSRDTSAFNYLSPVSAIVSKIRTFAANEYVENFINGEPRGYYRNVSVRITNLSLIGVYVAAALVLVIISYILYKNRKSESATEVVAFKAMRPVLLYSYAVVGAVMCTMILYLMFNLYSDEDYSAWQMAPLMFVSTVVIYFVGRMIIERSVRVFNKKTIPGGIVLTVLMVVFCFVLASDPGHEVTKVPAAEDVKLLQVSQPNGEYVLDENDIELMKYVIDVQQKIAMEGKREDPAMFDSYYMSFSYTLKSGKTIYRSYSFPIYDQNLSDPGSLESILREYVNVEPLCEKLYHLTDDTETDYMDVTVSRGEDGEYFYSDSIYDEDIDLVKEAILKDLREKKMPEADIFTFNTYDPEVVATLSYTDRYLLDPDSEDEDLSARGILFATAIDRREIYLWVNLNVTPEMTNTIAALRQSGFNQDF